MRHIGSQPRRYYSPETIIYRFTSKYLALTNGVKTLWELTK